MLKTVKTLVDQGTWAASSEIQVDLPTQGAITRLMIELELTVTACLAADTNTELAQWKPINTLKIEGGGGKAYFGMGGGEQMGRMIHFLNQVDHPGRMLNRRMATNTVFATFVLHFGSRPQDAFGRDNPFDLSAFIPAADETNLKLTWGTTQAADVCDTAIDITAGTMKVSAFQVLGLPNMKGMIPISSVQAFAHAANMSDLSQQFDVPTGSFLRRIAMISQDATAIGSGGPLMANDEIARAGLILTKDNRRLIELDYDALLHHHGIAGLAAMTAAGAVTKPADVEQPGFLLMDLRQYANPDYGLDLRRLTTGDVKLGLTIENYAAGDDTIIWYDTVQPYQGKGA